jgi:hypothetical protein
VVPSTILANVILNIVITRRSLDGPRDGRCAGAARSTCRQTSPPCARMFVQFTALE